MLSWWFHINVLQSLNKVKIHCLLQCYTTYICISYNTPSIDMVHIYARPLRAHSARGWNAYIPAISQRGGVMSYSLAPSECIDTGKTWPVYSYVLLGVVHAYAWGRVYSLNIVRATSKGPLGARLYIYWNGMYVGCTMAKSIKKR